MITYSKFILYLKLSLVMAALSILAILFIVSPPDRFGEPVKVSKLGLEKNIAYQILGAKLRGASEAGHRFYFIVDSIDPHHENQENFSLTNLTGTLSIFEKDIYNISANKALISSTDNYIDLVGDLKFLTKSGVAGKSQKIRLKLNSADAVVSSKVQLVTPLGTIFGGTMRITNLPLSNKKKPSLHLENGVKLIYQIPSEPTVE